MSTTVLRLAGKRSKKRVDRSSARIASPNGPRSHCTIGAPNPIFGRSMTSSGSTPRTASLKSDLATPPSTFSSMGRFIVNSTSRWSRNGTRGSIETDMPILSTRMRSSSGRRSLNSE